MNWYTGEAGSDSARSTAAARVDPSTLVSYGVRGNEQAIRNTVASAAVLAATTFSPSDPNAADRYNALTQRVGTTLAGASGAQKMSDIEADLAGAQTTMTAAQNRQTQTQGTLQDLLQQITTVPQEQVAAQILALQTNLPASLEPTAKLYQLSLVNHLS